MSAGWWDATERRGAIVAAFAAIAAALTGVIWGTYVAGGPDSYCYLNQAELFAQGRVRDPQPIVQDAPWPNRVDTAVPVGHVAAPRGEIAAVPMCPPGYPFALALARFVGGRAAMFWVVPIMGGLAVWWTFLIGRRVGGAAAGAMAAVLLATSPAFLYQIVQPTSDVPAAALWAAALVVAVQPPNARRAWLTGTLAGAALLIRPNLAPLGVVVAGMVVWAAAHAAQSPSRTTTDAAHSPTVVPRQTLALALGALPFFFVVMALQNAMYGGPLTSGYGSLSLLFSFDHIGPNLARYPRWLLETQTPLVLLALVAPWSASTRETRRHAWWLLAFVFVTFACYLPYTVYDAWWFLRFLLPAFPAMLVLTASVLVSLSHQVASNERGGQARLTPSGPEQPLRGQARLTPAGPDPSRLRFSALVLIALALVAFQLYTAERRAVFRLHDLERRFRDGGEYVARKLPENAVVFTTQQSGSVRYYAGRPTIIWDMLDPAWLDRALDHLRARGYRPYFLFERAEDLTFRQRFEAHSRFGGLEWPPIADIYREIRIFDPLDYERFRKGEKIETDYVFTRR
jgi:hypothetical protein